MARKRKSAEERSARSLTGRAGGEQADSRKASGGEGEAEEGPLAGGNVASVAKTDQDSPKKVRGSRSSSTRGGRKKSGSVASGEEGTGVAETQGTGTDGIEAHESVSPDTLEVVSQKPVAPPAAKKTAKQLAAEAKAAEAAAAKSQEPWTVLVHRKRQPGWVPYDPKTMRRGAPPAPEEPSEKVWRILSWNVNGLRSLLRAKTDGRDGTGEDGEEADEARGSGGSAETAAEAHVLCRLAERESADIICLQETKLQQKDVAELAASLAPAFGHCHWSCSGGKLGYSGTAILSRRKPLSVRVGMGNAVHDGEGRLVAAEFPGFFLVSAYVPNSGEKLRRLAYRQEEWDPALGAFVKELEASKPVILTGDLNCAAEEADIFHPDGNRRSAGFTEEERASFAANFLNNGLVDTFRSQHPSAVAYTYWGYRSRARPENRGWRLDYFLVSASLHPRVWDSYTLPDVGGSDHCPIGLVLRAAA